LYPQQNAGQKKSLLMLYEMKLAKQAHGLSRNYTKAGSIEFDLLK
jgi:hypothetical protein